jgi:hypothetical protein
MIRTIRAAGLAASVLLAMAGETVAQQGRVASFEMAWPTQRPQAVAAQAQAAAEAITGQQVRRRALIAPPTTPKSSSGRLHLSVPEAPTLDIVYLPDVAEFRIVDRELAASIAPEREMAQDEAVKLAKAAFDELARRKLVDAQHYNWDKPDVASTWVGGGQLGGASTERKRIEYRITVRRTINGIELANAGVRIAIHASGRVSGLRFGGVSVASRTAGNVEEPTGRGRWLNRQVANDALQARFQREIVPPNAKADVAWSRVMYVMPENLRNAVVQPLYVVSYSLQAPADDGQVAVSRRKTVGLSLVDATARPVDLTPPARAPTLETGRKPEPR